MERPNIVFLTWHDTGRHLGFHGIESVATPNLDRLAGESRVFTNAFCAAPVCGPSRSAMLTGRYPNANGMYGQPHEGWDFHPDETHLATRLAEHGYATAVCGFQHEGDAHRNGFHTVLANRPSEGTWFPPVPSASEVVATGLDWLDQRTHRDQAVYLQIGFWETHRPYDVPEVPKQDREAPTIPPYIKDTPTARKDFDALEDCIHAADAATGQLLEGLAARGFNGSNTIFIFMTDHGLAVPRAKLTGYDPGLEIAALFRWPGHINPGLDNRLVSNIDLLPTLADLDILPHDPCWQGESMFNPKPARDAVFACCYLGDLRIIRTARYKMIVNLSKLREYRAPVDLDDAGHYVLQRENGCKPVPLVELYDLDNDPIETENLADHPDSRQVRRTLHERLIAWMRDCNDPALKGSPTPPRWHEFLARQRARRT